MRYVTPICASLVALSLIAATAFAEKQREKPQKDEDRSIQNREVRVLDEKAEPADPIRASQVIGMNVQNPAGEEVGEVNDIVLDVKKGEVRYAALSVGGFLGIGDKLFAVPWKAFKCEKAEDGQERKLILNVDKQRLEKAPGFNQDSWPDFADREFTDLVDDYYSDDTADTRSKTAPRQRRQN
jgi:sporulation protein YlmC with PRC-barrel domain